MDTFRTSKVYAEAQIRANRQRAAMRHQVGILRNVGKNPLSLRGLVMGAGEQS